MPFRRKGEKERKEGKQRGREGNGTRKGKKEIRKGEKGKRKKEDECALEKEGDGTLHLERPEAYQRVRKCTEVRGCAGTLYLKGYKAIRKGIEWTFEWI